MTVHQHNVQAPLPTDVCANIDTHWTVERPIIPLNCSIGHVILKAIEFIPQLGQNPVTYFA